MKTRNAGTSFLICLGLIACGGGGGEALEQQPVNVDYSGLTIAASNDAPLEYARSAEQVLQPLRNGLRVSLVGGTFNAITVTPAVSAPGPHSDTTVQVEGVGEADWVKYDGHYIYAVRRELTSLPVSPQLARNVLDIARTDSLHARAEPIANYVIEGEQSTAPLLYSLQNQQGSAEYLVAISQNYQAWLLPIPIITTLVAQPDRTTIQLLDVRDPQNVSQAWHLQLDGWVKASRMIGDVLYIVSSFRPRIPDLVLPATTLEQREANERRILSSTARELLPSYAENGGVRQQLVPIDRCVIAQQVANHDGYADLVVITAINVRDRRITDANCLSTNVNGIYMSRESLYVAGHGYSTAESAPITVLHKFVLDGDELSYRATGAVVGTISWTNPSYFMDEHNGNLRILTTTQGTVHRLTVLRESADRRLTHVSHLPNAARPAPIGKPGEAVHAVRFMAERAYVVTFRVIDPLYVLDLADPADPLIAGELEIPGFSTYLRPVGATQSELLLSVGQQMTGGVRAGIKVELFDVRDISHPQSLGAKVLGGAGTITEALGDPHALTFLAMSQDRLRLALPVHVYDGAWLYSGLHLFEVASGSGATPQLHFQGVLEAEDAGSGKSAPSFALPNRGVLHGDSVFAVYGDRILSSFWHDVTPP